MVNALTTPLVNEEQSAWERAFEQRPQLQKGPARLVDLRHRALDNLRTTPFPTRRDEDWQYSDFTKALRLDWTLNVPSSAIADAFDPSIEDLDADRLILVDGIYRPELSDAVKGLRVSSIADAFADASLSTWLDQQLVDLSGSEANAFQLQNVALTEGGIVIDIPANTRLQRPLKILHVARRGARPTLCPGQVFIRAGQHAEAEVVETFRTIGEGEVIFRNQLLCVHVGKGARLAYRSLQQEDRQDYHVSYTTATQDGASNFDHLRVDLGGLQVRHNLNVRHLAAGLETHLYGLYFATGKQRMDNQTFLDHAFPHGESNELYKGIVSDEAEASFNGKVMVRPDAQKTNAFQQNNNLVIGDKAEVNAKPQLEIFADDVKCSHGATIGQLDESPVYYLGTRGIPRAEAVRMLQRAFLLEVLDSISLEPLRSYVEASIEQKFAES